ncbi:MAG: 50S ribosomal protein L19 [Candidatus Omnitrophica bacterium]|nr:50S ribosomal protein L19 [Candidatus Omnitrophota bacterium]
MDKRIAEIQAKQLKKELPKFAVGDEVIVYVKIAEAEKTRTQPFHGTVIARQHGNVNESFTVRRISYGEGVERTFLIHSPYVEKIEVVRTGKVKRAKLYYLRKKIGKKTKVEEKIIREQKKPADASLGKKS